MPRGDFNYCTANELRDIAVLLETLNAREESSVQPNAFKIMDSNGEALGWITMEDRLWVFAPATTDPS